MIQQGQTGLTSHASQPDAGWSDRDGRAPQSYSNHRREHAAIGPSRMIGRRCSAAQIMGILFPLLLLFAVGAGAEDQTAGYRCVPLKVPANGHAGFTLMDPRETGIEFTNTLSDQNAAQNQIRLNGSGVALGDVDGDGLCDIFVCSLEGHVALFKNLGGWRFTNVTAAAGLDFPGNFSTGATFADVDGNGALDLLINGIASTVTRNTYTNGVQGDGSYQVNSAHTLRAGFSVSAEQSFVGNSSLVEPCIICDGSDNGAPTNITDNVSKTGLLMGVYVQDEWKVTSQFTINAGLRFDQMDQFVSANQFSPRLSFTYKPFENTTFHAGYARYFTPPELVEAAPANIGLFNNTTGAVSGQTDPVLPERSHYFDAGADQKIKFGCASDGKTCSNLDLGVDAYYKIATDLLDNGLFGQALVLSGFNYARGYNEGVEFKAKYNSGNFQAYANVAVAQQRANDPVSNQFLFDNSTPLATLGGLTELQYLQTHFIYTDHNQFVTASAGAIYQFCGRIATAAEAFGDNGLSWCGIKLSADMIYGSGLRDGDANIGTVPSYTQVNVGIKREFLLPNDPKPMTIRFDVVNLFDSIYEIRDGSGIGVFAPQFGPRRGFFLGLSKKI